MPTSCTMRWSGSDFSTADEAAPDAGWSDWLAELAQHRRVTRLDAPHAPLWIAAERLPQFQALVAGGAASSPRSRRRPPMPNANGRARRRWSKSCAAGSRGWVRSTRKPLAAPLGLAPAGIAAALAALEAEGFAMRGRFTPRRGGRGMVRAPAAGAHSRLHRQAPAGRDRAGGGARLPAFPARLAARDRRTRAWRGRTRSTPWSASSKASRRRPAPGRPRSCRRGSPATSRPGSTIAASPGRSPGRACGRGAGRAGNGRDDDRTAARARRRRRCAPRRSRCRAPSRRALGVAVIAGPDASSPASGRSRCRSHSRAWRIVLRRARGRHAACCAPRSKRRWPNWWRWAW